MRNHSKKQRNRAIPIAVLGGLLLFVFGFSKPMEPDRLIIDSWKMCPESVENHEPSAVPRDCLWQDIDAHTLFTAPFPYKKKMQYLWLKAEVFVEQPQTYYGISLGRIFLADTVYINGEYCGEHGRNGVQEFHYPRNYIIPNRTLIKGGNEVLVCLGLYGREFGGLRETVALLSKNAFNRKLLLDNLLYFQIPLGVILMFAGMFIMVILSYDARKMAPSIWILLGILGIWFTHLMTIFSPFQPFSLEFRINYLWLCLFVNSALFILVLQYTHRCIFHNLNRVVLPVIFASALITLIFNDTTATYYPGRILGPLVLILDTPVTIYMFIRFKQLRPDASFSLFWIFGVIPVTAISLDVFNYLYGTHTPPFYHVYTIPAVNILVVLLQRKRFKNYRMKFTRLIERLEAEGASDSVLGEKFIPVPQPLEKKLDEVKAFIDDHFTSPITREGLAERLDLSPDYMSRMFKKYFGVKINHYINDRRIDKACFLLRETDEKIIDIAFSVGFESLTTFSRAFTKKNKVSPTEYRIRTRPLQN